MIQVRIYRAVNGTAIYRRFWRQASFRELPRIGETIRMVRYPAIKVKDIEHDPDNNSLDVILETDDRPLHDQHFPDDIVFQEYRNNGWHREEE